MKKLFKIMLCLIGTFTALVVMFRLSFLYVTKYKKTTCDTSVSPNQKYELILQAIGEPDWPFGTTYGRLILKEGKNKLSQTDFQLYHDGKMLNKSCWKVTWHDEYVEIILSGEEQKDEQVLLFFNGDKEAHQLNE